MWKRDAIFRIKITSEGKSREEEISKASFVIGRSDSADLQVTTSGVSRSHLHVELKNGEIWIKDLGSSNGSKLNGKKLTANKAEAYKPGETINLGLGNDSIVITLVKSEKEAPAKSQEDSSHSELPPLPLRPNLDKVPDKMREAALGKSPEEFHHDVPPFEKSVDRAVIKIPPIPGKEGAGEDSPEKTLDRTLVDPAFKRLGQAQSNAMQEQVLEEAKAVALRIKIAAETEAARIMQLAKERALAEVTQAREKAEEIVAKATDQAFRVQKEGEVEATKMRQAMQDAIAKVHLEIEQKAEILRKGAREKGDQMVREAREKGEKTLADYQAKAEKLLSDARMTATMTKGDAQKEADAVLSQAYQKTTELKNSWESEAKNFQKEEKKKAADLIAAAQEEADEVLQEARKASSMIRSNIEKELSEIRKNAEAEAEKIITEAQKEAEVSLSIARGQVEAQRENLGKLKGNAESEARQIKAEAQKDADLILFRAHEQSEGVKEQVDKVLSDAEDEAMDIRTEAKNAVEKVISRTKDQAEQQKMDILQTAIEEADKMRDETLRDAKKEALTLLKNAENERSGLAKAIEKLNLDVGQLEKKKVDVNNNIKTLQKKNSDVKDQSEELAAKLAQNEIETNKKIEELRAKTVATEALLATKVAEVEKQTKESQKILDTVKQAETLTRNAKDEKDKLAKIIEDLKKQEIQLSKGLQLHTQQIDAEKNRQRDAAEREIKTFKDDSNAEIKRLREKAQADFTSRKAEQEAELAKMRMTELETIKGLRAEEEARFNASRKHQILEISKALETYLVPRLKEQMDWKELPKPLANMFPELKDIVGRVLEGQFSGVVANTAMDVGGKGAPSRKNKKRNTFIVVSAGLAVLVAIFFVPFSGSGVRKPASELFIERLREKEAQKPKFVPKVTEEYKSSYTDNVIYTKDYVDFKLNPDNQGKWIQDLNRFFVGNLGLNENAIVKFISIESNLVSQLKELRPLIHYENQKEDVKKMTDLEKDTVKEMIEVLGTPEKYKSFREFEKNYFTTNRQPATANPEVPSKTE